MLLSKFLSTHTTKRALFFCLFACVLTTANPKNRTVSPPVITPPKTNPSWLDIQKQITDTVVQVFTYSTEFDWIEPYKTPNQSHARGSGFFISNRGDLLTNYHVIRQANSIEIQVPSCGMERFAVEIIGVCPIRDIALLRLTNESQSAISQLLGKSIPSLSFGDSDKVIRAQEVMAMGFPLGQTGLKSTLGIVSGRERLDGASFIQISAPINPGNSGGPALNNQGLVIGINTCSIHGAQNVNYIIPINEVQQTITDLYTTKFLRKPNVGGLFSYATPELAAYFGNPSDGGCYIKKVYPGDFLDSIGIKEGDMLYEFNGYPVDFYGEIQLPEREDRVSIYELIDRFTIGETVTCTIYRNGKQKKLSFKYKPQYVRPVRIIHPKFEPEATDYEILGGMVVMQLSLNHVALLSEYNPKLINYFYDTHTDPALIITHVLPNSQAYKSHVLVPGDIIEYVNNQPVKTLNDFRQAVLKNNHSQFITIKTEDQSLAALSIDKILKEENILAATYFFKRSSVIEQLRA